MIALLIRVFSCAMRPFSDEILSRGLLSPDGNHRAFRSSRFTESARSLAPSFLTPLRAASWAGAGNQPSPPASVAMRSDDLEQGDHADGAGQRR